jgi:hypothetical protein
MTTIIPANPHIRARVHFPNEAGGLTIFMCRVVAWRIDKHAHPIFSCPLPNGSLIDYCDPTFGDGSYHSEITVDQLRQCEN